MSTQPTEWTLDSGGWPLIVNGPDADMPASIVAIIPCDADEPHAYNAERAEAHARLLTAAPRLLSLLRWYVYQFMPDDHIRNHAGSDCPHCDARTLLRSLEEDEVEHYSDGEGHDVWIG